MNKVISSDIMPLQYYAGSDSFQLIELLSYIVGMQHSGFYHVNQMKTFLTTLRNIHCLKKMKDQSQDFQRSQQKQVILTNLPEVVQAWSNSNNIMPQIQAYAAFCILDIQNNLTPLFSQKLVFFFSPTWLQESYVNTTHTCPGKNSMRR